MFYSEGHVVGRFPGSNDTILKSESPEHLQMAPSSVRKQTLENISSDIYKYRHLIFEIK